MFMHKGLIYLKKMNNLDELLIHNFNLYIT